MANKWKNDVDGLLLTRGQLLADSLVWSMVNAWNRKPVDKYTVTVRSDILTRYIEKMRGDAADLVQDLKAAYLHSFDKPQDIHRLRRAAQSRKELEAYIKKLEIARGKREPMPQRKYREARGWSVRQLRGQKLWRICLTSMQDGRPTYVKGSWRRRDDAEKAARAIVAKLRSEAA